MDESTTFPTIEFDAQTLATDIGSIDDWSEIDSDSGLSDTPATSASAVAIADTGGAAAARAAIPQEDLEALTLSASGEPAAVSASAVDL